MELKAIYITGAILTFIFTLMILELLKLLGISVDEKEGVYTEKLTGKEKVWGIVMELIVAAAAGFIWFLTVASCTSCLIFMLTGANE